MIRAIPAFLALALLGAACLGGGDKDASPAATSRPAASPTARAQATPETADVDETEAGTDGLGSVFSSIFGGGLSGATGSTAGLGAGDPSLKQFLPAAEDFPEGYVPFGEFTFSTPDQVSANGKIDMAASMAMTGDLTGGDLSSAGMLMAMVMHPQDLQDLGGSLGSIKDIDPDQLEAEIRKGIEQGAGVPGLGISDVQVMDLPGVGDGGFGMQMVMDIGGLVGSLPGGEDAPFDSMSMRMYIFANGDYIGATMRIAYTDTLPGDDAELTLARAIDSKLDGAP